MNLRNTFFYITGIAFLVLTKAKTILKGYSSPKPFDITESARCIEYDINVVENWLLYLQRYTQSACSLSLKNVLELGPGSDLGTGIYLIAKGCSQYNACDVNDLMKSTPDNFYERLFVRLQNINSHANIDFLREQLKEAKAGNNSRLNYVVDSHFNIFSVCGESTIDLVFSQAAFEHFDDIEETISQLSSVCKPGAILVAEIDLQTHSRWIREKDPNNIYRFPTCLYNAFWYDAIPNRLRPYQYKEAFERFGWTDISIIPLRKLDDHDRSYSGMNKTFAHKQNQMEYLSIILCAKKKETA
jgi:SAM-dependent methyltransferase